MTALTFVHMHGAVVSELAAMACLSRNLLRQFADKHRVDLSRLLEWQRTVLLAYLIEQDISVVAFSDAIAMLERTGSA